MTNTERVPATSEEPQPVLPGAACKRMGIHTRTLTRWIEAGLIKVQYTAGGHVRVPVSEIERIATGGIGRKKGQHYERRDPRAARARGEEIARHVNGLEAAARQLVSSGLTGRQIAAARERGREMARRINEQERRKKEAAAARKSPRDR